MTEPLFIRRYGEILFLPVYNDQALGSYQQHIGKESLFTLQNSTNLCQWKQAFNNLKNIPRLEAYKLVEYLPYIVSPKADKSSDTWKATEYIYRTVSGWLQSWEKEEYFLPESGNKQSQEDFALLMEARFRLCRGIHKELGLRWEFYKEFTLRSKPGFLWLMAEASFCRQAMNSQISRKRTAYDNVKSRKNYLLNKALEPSEKIEFNRSKKSTLQTFVHNAVQIVEDLAAQLSDNEDFYQKYFEDYKNKLTSWGAGFNKTGQTIVLGFGAKQKRRGGKIGHKKGKR